jgi:hypothetical protein
MKYSSHNLNESGIELPLQFPLKVVVEYRPGGVLTDHVPAFCAVDPEVAVDNIVRERGWDKSAGYDPLDVWIDGAF